MLEIVLCIAPAGIVVIGVEGFTGSGPGGFRGGIPPAQQPLQRQHFGWRQFSPSTTR